MIRVLIVDDSPSIRLLLKTILDSQPDIQVVGTVSDGIDALEQVVRLKPDVVTMDIQMPLMDGIQTTRQLMYEHPVPVVVISSAVEDPDLQVTFHALEEGAAAVLAKPPAPTHSAFNAACRDLVDTVRTMADLKVIRRRLANGQLDWHPPPKRHPIRCCEIVAIATSTGGPQALTDILSALPADFPVPVVVVQHISEGFLHGMVEWLRGVCSIQCEVCQDAQALLPGHVYFAPDGKHLTLERLSTKLYARLLDGEPILRHLPSANPLFQSVAQVCRSQAIGVILTGMGTDGANGLLKMRHSGSATLAQSPQSCIVPNMPQSAIELGAIGDIVPLHDIANRLLELTGHYHSPSTTGEQYESTGY